MKTAEILGLDVDLVSNKCANFSAFFLKCASEGEDYENVITYMRENFNENELIFFSLYWLCEKTEEVQKTKIMEIFRENNPN